MASRSELRWLSVTEARHHQPAVVAAARVRTSHATVRLLLDDSIAQTVLNDGAVQLKRYLVSLDSIEKQNTEFEGYISSFKGLCTGIVVVCICYQNCVLELAN